MREYIVKKEVFSRFLNKVMKNNDLVAPVEGSKEKKVKKSYFKKIDSPDEIYLEKKTYYPVKGFFFDRNEIIFNFKGNKIIEPEIRLRPMVFFGLRKCDLNSIWHQDIVFLDENADPFYKARRDSSLLIGLHCNEGDDYCFCNSFELKNFFDIMFYDKGDFYGVELGSEKGEKFVSKFVEFFVRADNVITEEDRKTINKKSLKNSDIKDFYNKDEWKQGADKCVSCGACNFLCPNCHCFDFEDSVDFSLKTGKRIRRPASCQLRSFTRVAGDHIFRISRLSRFKHRIYHQIQYFKDRHNVIFCTGCGRCIEGCPVRIDWVDIINKMMP